VESANASAHSDGSTGHAGSADEMSEEDMGLSYEHRALESILVDTANALEEEMAFVRRLVRELLDSFEHDINRDNLRKLLHYSRRLAGFQSRAKYTKSAFDELLESDEDLNAMYLTDKLQGKPRSLNDHEQLELLLESFTKQAEEVVSEIDTMVVSSS
jgi:magnesium transporter